MEGIRFTRNRQNTRSFWKFLAGNPTRLPALVAGRWSQKTGKIGKSDRSVLSSPLGQDWVWSNDDLSRGGHEIVETTSENALVAKAALMCGFIRSLV